MMTMAQAVHLLFSLPRLAGAGLFSNAALYAPSVAKEEAD